MTKGPRSAVAELGAGAGALIAIAVCCGVPALAGAAVAAAAASVVTRSIVLGIVVLGLLTLAVSYRARRRARRDCSGTAAHADDRAERS